MSLQSQKSTWTSVTPNKESSSLLHSCPNLQPQKLRTRLAKLWTNYCGGWRFTPRDGHFLMDNQLTSRAAETEKGSTICPADLFFFQFVHVRFLWGMTALLVHAWNQLYWYWESAGLPNIEWPCGGFLCNICWLMLSRLLMSFCLYFV